MGPGTHLGKILRVPGSPPDRWGSRPRAEEISKSKNGGDLLRCSHGAAMIAKVSLMLTLAVSLFFATQVFPLAAPAGLPRGRCAQAPCRMGCCASKACCMIKQAQETPPPPMLAASGLDFQLGPIGWPVSSLLYPLPAARRAFAIRDDARTSHTLPLRAVTCIRLI